MWEETGVTCQPKGILGFRENLDFRFGRTDFYFVVVCQSDQTEIKLDP